VKFVKFVKFVCLDFGIDRFGNIIGSLRSFVWATQHTTDDKLGSVCMSTAYELLHLVCICRSYLTTGTELHVGAILELCRLGLGTWHALT
jgi:hypothetical protein